MSCAGIYHPVRWRLKASSLGTGSELPTSLLSTPTQGRRSSFSGSRYCGFIQCTRGNTSWSSARMRIFPNSSTSQSYYTPSSRGPPSPEVQGDKSLLQGAAQVGYQPGAGAGDEGDQCDCLQLQQPARQRGLHEDLPDDGHGVKTKYSNIQFYRQFH